MVCPRCGRKSSGKICVWCRSGRNLSEYSIKDYDKYSAEIPEEDSYIQNDNNDNTIPQNGGTEEAESESPSENTREQKDPIDPNGRGRSRKKRVARQPQRSSERNDKKDLKKKKEKDSKIRAMQSELEDLRARQQEHDRRERDRKRQEKQERRQSALEAKRQSREILRSPAGQAEKIENTAQKVIVEKTVKEPVKETVKPAVLAIVGFSRLLQLASAVLMALLTVMSAFSFWQNRDGLGGVMTIVDERNYGLALYLASAAGVIFFGMIWTLWIMSRKGAGGEVRMKTYDTGRGLIPFLLCLGAVYAVTRLSDLVPEDGAMWHGMAKAVAAGVTAVQSESRQLMLVSIAGASLSLIRKLLRV
ncbi:hypothetical protein [Brotaphodocola sp.]|uniref:hypothetical protein n=1 Tax=Brotaphodocola sp. TaxID=3073577 RepID=UPI003D7C41CB